MIVIDNISKSFELKSGRKDIFKNASITIPTHGNIAVLGKDGSGKSVLIKLIGNSIFPDAGKIKITEKISWPVGFKGQLVNNLTGTENIEFISMLKYSDSDKRKKIRQFIAEFTELGKALDMPIKTYSKSMRDRLSFALCFAYPFDTYLVDEFSFSSDSLLKEKAQKFIKSERKDSRLITTTKNLQRIKEDCQYIILIKDCQLFLFDDIMQGIEEYQKMFTNKEDAFSDSVN